MGNAKTYKRKAQQKRKRERDLVKEAAANVLQGASSWMHTYTVVRNIADGNCALWAVFFLVLLDGGMDARTAHAVLSLKDASPEERAAIKDFMMLCRKVVGYARLTGQTLYPVNGPVRTEEQLRELFRGGEIRTDGEWELAHLKKDSYFCEEGARLLGELLGLHGTTVVQECDTGLFDVKSGELTDTGLPMSNLVLRRGHHSEAMIPKESMEKSGADRSGAGDCTWVLEYLTELLSAKFDVLVAQHSVCTGTKNSMPGDSVSLLFSRVGLV